MSRRVKVTKQTKNGNSFFSNKKVVVSDYERGFRDGVTSAYTCMLNTMLSVFISASFANAMTSKTLVKAFNNITKFHRFKTHKICKKARGVPRGY